MEKAWGQCGPCTITFSGNGNPTPNRNIQDGDVVCILGNRSSRINLRNRDDLTICIANGVIYSNDFANLNGDDITINNYGQFGDPGTNRDLRIRESQVLNNFGSVFFRNVTNEGLINSSSGTLTVERDLENDEGILNLGNTSVGGDFINNNLVTLAGSLTVEDDLDNDDNDAIIRPLNTNQCNTISVGGDIDTDDGRITGNNLTGPFKAPLLVNKSPDDGNLTGGAIVDPSLDCSDTNGPPSGGCWQYIDDGTVSGIVIIEFFDDCVWEAPTGLLEFEVLVVGGGGGGGADAGGGGGAGGLVHARALVSEIESEGLPVNSSFNIDIGPGGDGSTTDEDPGQDGSSTTFDLGGIYEVIAAGGGGGGSSDSEGANDGFDSSISSTTGFSVVGGNLFGSSGGGAGNDGNNGDRGQGGTDGNRGGRGDENAGGGGGGVEGDGQNADEEEGGNGGGGIQIMIFDDRIYAAGGGGGGVDSGGTGGSSVGGDGGEEDEDGEDGLTPGSGGGGGGEDANGGVGADGVVIVRYEIARILPVEFLSFQSTYHLAKRTGLLEWSTSKEWENSHFEIERAINTVKEWETIGRVEGQGYSQSPVSYSFEDTQLPAAGGMVYYRIKQVDFDGKSSYSVTRSVRVNPVASNLSWVAYPVPSQVGTAIQLELLNPEAYHDELIGVTVSSVTGVAETFLFRNPNELQESMAQKLAQMPRGLYLVNISWGEKSQQVKLLIQ
jgi:hypothetical protein